MKLPLFSSRKYDTDYTLELFLSSLIRSRIESISRDDNYFNTIVFKNGTLYYWKCNWPYAVFSRGTISIKTTDNKEITYKWNEAMPSRKLIKKLLAKIDNFIVNNN